MNGGRMTTSRFAIAAVATALMGTTAMAADLGGNCCADLEERIAELEATTVRKGNRKVSLPISGFVSHHVMWWDDGTQTRHVLRRRRQLRLALPFPWRSQDQPRVDRWLPLRVRLPTNAISAVNQLNGGDDLGGTAGCPVGGNIPSCSHRDRTVWLKHSRSAWSRSAMARRQRTT